VVATGNVYDCNVGHPPGKYNGVYVFNADRSRFNADGYDWQSVPVDTGAPLSESYSVIENNQPNPVVADLDNDGRPDVVAGTSSGLTVAPNVIRIWRNADATPFSGGWTSSTVTTTVATYSGILEVAVVDLDRDGWRDIVSAHYYGPAEGGVYVWHNDHTPFAHVGN